MRTMLIFNGGLFLINAVLFVALWLGTRREAPRPEGDYVSFTHDQLRRWEG